MAIDCTGLDYINSRGISSFLASVDRCRAHGGDVKLFGLQPQCLLVFSRLGLDRFIQLVASEEDAVEAFTIPISDYLSDGVLREYVASEQGRSFHLSSCAAARRIAATKLVRFASKWHARKANKAACRRCNP